MSTHRTMRAMLLAATVVLVAGLVLAVAASAFPGLALESRFGGKVNVTKAGAGPTEDICTVYEACQNGSSGETAGWFKSPYGVAVNESNGDAYVSENQSERVSEFGPEGEFKLAFGGGVAASGPDSVSEQQTVTVTATGGTFTLTFGGQTTGSINYNEAASGVQTDLNALSSIKGVGGSVKVTSMTVGSQLHIYGVTFGGSLAGASQTLMTAAGSLTGGRRGGNVSVAYGGLEVCKVGVDVCKAGVLGPGVGELALPQGVAVDNTCYEQNLTESTVPACKTADPSNGDVYVVDPRNYRVQVFDLKGNFIRMFGGSVNANGPSNVCPAAEAGECQTGTEGAGTGQFKWGAGNFIAVGSAIVSAKVVTTVYVGDENRVQKFSPTGVSEGEIQLPGAGNTEALAVDSSENVYVKSASHTGVQEYGSSGGSPIHEFDTTSTTLKAIAVVSAGEFVVSDERVIPKQGLLYDIFSGSPRLLQEWGEGAAGSGQGLGYNTATERLYVAESSVFQDVEIYRRVPFPAAVTTTSPQPVPVEVAEKRSVVVKGEVNPEDVDTNGYFEYGMCGSSCASSAFGEKHVAAVKEGTTTEDLGAGGSFENVESKLEGLQPNKNYHYRVVAHNNVNHTVNATTTGAEGTFLTPAIKPAIDQRGTSFIAEHSVALVGLVNPNNELTSYVFEYGLCTTPETCSTSPYAESTLVGSAGEGYADVGVYHEITGLEPEKTYHYKLVATNGQGSTKSAEGTFTTLAEPQTPPAPPESPPTVVTGAASSVGAETAVIAGSVNPNGSPTDYVFEVGVYNGSETRFGIVSSGEVGTGVEPLGEAYQLLNLQAGVTYASRITASNAYDPASGPVQGAIVTFTTQPAPVVLTAPIAPALLTTPHILFPDEVKLLTNAQKLANALRACQKKPKKKRAACKRAARKKYAVSKP